MSDDPNDPNPTPEMFPYFPPSPTPPLRINLLGKAKCECGAKKTYGVKDYEAGHADFCPVKEIKHE